MALPHIQIGDNLIGDALLSSVEVIQELNQHWWCTIVCKQTPDQRIPVEDFLGKTVSIRTTDQNGTDHVQFSGFVLKVDLDYEIWGSYTAQILAVSSSYMMDVTAHKQYYSEQTLSSIGNTVAGRAGISFSMNGGSSKALSYVQYGETDFSFLSRIVDDYACWLRPSENGVEVFNSFQGGTSVHWRGEDGLLDFRLSGMLSPTAVSGSHYDHHAMQSNTFEKVSTTPSYYDSAQRLTSSVQSASAKLPAAFEPQRARAMTLDDYQASWSPRVSVLSAVPSPAQDIRAINNSLPATPSCLKAHWTQRVLTALSASSIIGLRRALPTLSCAPRGKTTATRNLRSPTPGAASSWLALSHTTILKRWAV